jgi:hypothetical protein
MQCKANISNYNKQDYNAVVGLANAMVRVSRTMAELA